MVTESQKAFDAWLTLQRPDGVTVPVHRYFSSVERRCMWIGFEAGIEYGRKQALEELKAAFLKFENNKVAQLEIVKELIK